MATVFRCSGSSDVMRMVFPDGLDAFNNRSNSLYAAADRWQATLQSGGTTYDLEISGRSNGFAIDYIELVKN